MRWIIRVYSFVLLAYTGWRTMDFLLSQLPKNDMSLWLSIAFLFAAEAGLLLWHEVSLNHTTTAEQHRLAVSLTWIDFVASLLAGTADMIIRQTMIADYYVPMWLAQLLIYGLPVVMAGNVAGVLLYLSNDAETQLDASKKQLRFEITRQAIRELRDNQGQIAESMKKGIYSQLRDDVTGKLEKQYQRSATNDTHDTKRKAPVMAPIPPGGNGTQRNYNSEVPLVDQDGHPNL
jgi:hypothetical protein